MPPSPNLKRLKTLTFPQRCALQACVRAADKGHPLVVDKDRKHRNPPARVYNKAIVVVEDNSGRRRLQKIIVAKNTMFALLRRKLVEFEHDEHNPRLLRFVPTKKGRVNYDPIVKKKDKET